MSFAKILPSLFIAYVLISQSLAIFLTFATLKSSTLMKPFLHISNNFNFELK